MRESLGLMSLPSTPFSPKASGASSGSLTSTPRPFRHRRRQRERQGQHGLADAGTCPDQGSLTGTLPRIDDELTKRDATSQQVRSVDLFQGSRGMLRHVVFLSEVFRLTGDAAPRTRELPQGVLVLSYGVEGSPSGRAVTGLRRSDKEALAATRLRVAADQQLTMCRMTT